MSIDPLVLYAFRTELEKEAVFTPNSALRAMKSPNRFIRGAGRLGAEAQGFAATATPGMLDTVSNYPDPAFMISALKGETIRAGARRAAATLSKKRKKLLELGGDWSTFVERNVPELPGATDVISKGLEYLPHIA